MNQTNITIPAPSQIQTQVVCPVHIVCISPRSRQVFFPLSLPPLCICFLLVVELFMFADNYWARNLSQMTYHPPPHSTGAFLKCFFLKCSCNAFPLLYISPHPPQRSEPFPWEYSTWWSNQTWWLNSFAQRWHALCRSATHIQATFFSFEGKSKSRHYRKFDPWWTILICALEPFLFSDSFS